jgi:LDH2 family malate/lactate/ureidoglycolate dehydrogenase
LVGGSAHAGRSTKRRSAATSWIFSSIRTPPRITGQSILAVRVDAFCPVEVFKRNVDVAVRAIREAQRLPGFDRIWLPGEQSHTKRVERLVLGIPIPPTLHKNLDELAGELGIDPIM